MPARFPYLPVASDRGDASLMPLVPLQLRFKDREPVQAHGLLDSGATVSVPPYGLGVNADPFSSDFSATRLVALLPALLDPAFKGEL